MPAPALPSPAPIFRRAIWGCAAQLAAATVGVYCNTFRVPFLFDDLPSIEDNPSILHLSHLWRVLHPQAGFGLTVSGRPILNLSLALNYAWSGFSPWSYHVLNLLIHVGAALVLFGLIRRTLTLAAGAPTALPAARRWQAQRVAMPGGAVLSEADLLALGAALLWSLHPLQTEAVTYIIQRTESLMAFFYLLTFYCFVRSLQSARPRRWRVLAVVSCLLCVGTKEVSATIPVVLFLYDRTFAAGTFAEAWRRRRWFHLAIAATWLPLLGLVASTGWNRGGTAGFDVGVAPWAYWFTQFEAIARYLRQTFWPHPLVFDYGTFYMTASQAAPYALVVVPVAAATLYALWRHPVPGFLGGWFFAILAPTSLVPGTIQMIVEHRMYLPLAAVIVLVTGLAGARWGGRRVFAVCLILALPEGWLTVRRNRVYYSDLSLWQDTVAHSPGSALAQSGLGSAYYERNRPRQALYHYLISYGLKPDLPSTNYNLGLAYSFLHRPADAAKFYARTIRLNPLYYPANYQLGMTLVELGRPQEALAQFARAVQIMPEMAKAHYQWGATLVKLGRSAEAVPHLEQALRLQPDYVSAECELGVALYQSGHPAEAEAALRRALKLDPNQAEAHFNLGLLLAGRGHPDEALAQYVAAVRLDPNNVEAQLNLGIAFAQADRLPDALAHLQQAVRLAPGLAAAHCNLGIVLAQSGRLFEAVDQYREALRLQPDYASAHYNLGNALLELREVAAARREFEAALRQDPGFEPAREMLDRLQSSSFAP